MLAYARADSEARRFWQRTIAEGIQNEGDLKRAIALVEESGAIGETRDRAQRYADEACEDLSVLPESDIRRELIALAEFCVGRGY